MATFLFSDGGYTTLNQIVSTSPSPGTVETWTLESTVGSPALPQIISGQQYAAAVFTPNLTLAPPQGTELNPEIVLVTAILNSTQVTVSRGYNGITQAHSPGDVFQCVIAAEWLNAVATGGGSLSNPVTVAQGGTGATTAAGALTALAGGNAPNAASGLLQLNSSSQVPTANLPTSTAPITRATVGPPIVLSTDQVGDFAFDAANSIMYGPLTGTPVTGAYWNNAAGGSSAAVTVITVANLAIATSPAINVSGYSGANSLAWASNTFSPAAGSVIVVVANALLGGVAALSAGSTITDSLGTHLTWNKVADVSNSGYGGATAVFWAYCPTAQTSMTVTVTMTVASVGINSMGVGVSLITNGAGIGQVVTGESFSQNLSVALTPTVRGSAIFLAATNADYSAGTTSAGAGTFAKDNHVGYSGGTFSTFLLGSSTTALTLSGVALAPVTLIADDSTSNSAWVYAAFEVL